MSDFDVGRRAVALLGGHVGQRASLRLGRGGGIPRHGRGGREADSKIRYLHRALRREIACRGGDIQEDVFRLDVPVHDLTLVSILKRFQYVTENVHRLRQGQTLAGNPGAKDSPLTYSVMR